MVYDVHAHCIPDGVLDDVSRRGDDYGLELLSQDGKSRLRVGERLLGPLRDDLSDSDARLAAMDDMGVDVQLLSAWVSLYCYELDEPRLPRWSRLLNESLATTVQANSDRFLGLGTAPLSQPEAAVDELRHVVEQLGMVGVQLATSVTDLQLDDATLRPFWELAESLGAIIVLHPEEALTTPATSRFMLGNMVARPFETTAAAAQLVLGGVLERYPTLNICVVHGGGFLPYQAGRMQRGYLAKPGVVAKNLTRSPVEWLRSLYYDTIVHDAHALRFLIDFAGAEHVVLGSDYPFEMGDPDPVASVHAVEGVDDHDRTRILEGNLKDLLTAMG